MKCIKAVCITVQDDLIWDHAGRLVCGQSWEIRVETVWFDASPLVVLE